MNRTIDPEIHGDDMRMSCLADFIELEAYKNGAARTEAEVADLIGDSDWEGILSPRYEGGELDFAPHAAAQETSREQAAAITAIVEQRRNLLDDLYPFDLGSGRRVETAREAKPYLWYLFVSLLHGLAIPNIPSPTDEFEKIVAGCLVSAGLSASTVGTSMGFGNFNDKVAGIGGQFPGLVITIDDAVISRSQNDAGIDTFGMFRCGRDNRHAQWAFIGQSTVARSNSWPTKIYEPKPAFWRDVFGRRIIPIPFFATPHHIPDDYLLNLDYHERCLLDRIRLTNWTNEVPASFHDYSNAVAQLTLE